ncbi:MAG: hypothetical protein FJ290_07495 [Planctomycetes bacterium]|nr:hypothetical protein [Planctomycetota bacterium]
MGEKIGLRCLLLAVALSSGQAAHAVEVLFYAPFDGSVDAKAAKGDPKGKFTPQRGKPDAQPVFSDGIAGKAVTSGGPYVVTTACPLKVPEYVYWGDEWSPSRTGRRAEGGIGQCSVAAASWRDFFLWCYRRLYDRGRFVGLYYDCAPYLPDDNVYHGGGCRDGQRVLPTNNVLAAREGLRHLLPRRGEQDDARHLAQQPRGRPESPAETRLDCSGL